MLLRLFLLATFLIMPISTFAQNIPPIEKGVSQNLAKWRAANYSDVRYKLNLTIEKKAPTLKGSMEISVKSKSDHIIVDWRKIRGSEELSKITNVSINNVPLKLKNAETANDRQQMPVYEERDEHLIFIDGVIIGENVIKLDFESPILTSGSAITRYIDKEDGSEYIYSLFVPSDASTAFPVFDQPDLKAVFDLQINSTSFSKAVSNSTASHIDVSGGKLNMFGFRPTKPISTYVFAFAAGEFEEFSEKSHKQAFEELEKENKTLIMGEDRFAFDEDIREKKGTQIYVRKSQAEKFKPHAEEVFRLNRESIKYLEDYFDYKFPFPKYDLVLIPEFPFGGMEHAGATFLRESSIIFPTEPTANNYISRANLIFHENAHQWFGDTVTMKWFDDLWLKEGFATFMAYKTMEKVLPEYNAWKVFYERTKPLAYQTDVTRGTTPIYQEIPNLNSAKSAYGNIVYQKAPGFLKQAEFYLGNNKFQEAVQSFIKKYQFKNAEWKDLVNEFENVACAGNYSSTFSESSYGNRIKETKCLEDTNKKRDLSKWADSWVKQRGVPIIRVKYLGSKRSNLFSSGSSGISLPSEEVYRKGFKVSQQNNLGEKNLSEQEFVVRIKYKKGYGSLTPIIKSNEKNETFFITEVAAINATSQNHTDSPLLIFPNYQDYGYGIFLLDEKSKKYILENIQDEKDDFLRSMMWGSLWDSVRFAELDPKDYVELAIKNIGVETDVSTISSILARVETAMTYYLTDAQAKEIAPKLESLLIDKMKTAKTEGERITFYRAFLGIASSENARQSLKEILNEKFKIQNSKLKSKDRFDIVTRLIILGDKAAPKLLAELEKTETDDATKRYAYAAKAGFATAENKAKYWNDFIDNKEISESWIEEAMNVWNSPSHSELTLPYLEKALAELPNHKQNRKIFFVNGWVASFIGGQDSKEALEIVNKFLKDNPNLDIDLQRKILERVDGLERAVKIREKYRK